MQLSPHTAQALITDPLENLPDAGCAHRSVRCQAPSNIPGDGGSPRNFAAARTSRKWAPFRVGYLRMMRPYPSDYRTAFAFSDLPYPLCRPPSLRSGYRRSGAHRAYPVDNRGGASQSGWDLSPGGDCGCRRRQHPTHGPPHGAVWLRRDSLFRRFTITGGTVLRSRSTLWLFPTPHPR